MIAVLAAGGGCRPIGFAPRLVGVWVGVPETAEQRTARSSEAVKGNASPAAVEQPDDEPSDAVASEDEGPALRSTLEALDVRVTLDLAADGRVRMWMGDAEDEALRGDWRVASYERDRAVLEIVIQRGDGQRDPGSPDEAEARDEKRRFALHLLEGDQAFTLFEEGADRFFGRLSFRRVERGL